MKIIILVLLICNLILNSCNYKKNTFISKEFKIKWKSDTLGCNNFRQKNYNSIIVDKKGFYGKSKKNIISNFGQPDLVDSERNFILYYCECGINKKSNPSNYEISYLSFDFNKNNKLKKIIFWME